MNDLSVAANQSVIGLRSAVDQLIENGQLLQVNFALGSGSNNSVVANYYFVVSVQFKAPLAVAATLTITASSRLGVPEMVDSEVLGFVLGTEDVVVGIGENGFVQTVVPSIGGVGNITLTVENTSPDFEVSFVQVALCVPSNQTWDVYVP